MKMALHYLGRVEYASTLAAMQSFSAARTAQTPDQLWLCEHPPVFTQGLAGRSDHLLAPGAIAVVQTDRGGQVTYHGPGQLIAYPLIDLRRAGYFVKEYVYRLEEALLRTLNHYGVSGHRVAGAPGVYLRLRDPFGHALLAQRPQQRAPGSAAASPDFNGVGKIAALGIKISRHCAYHGVALNVAMDLSPYDRINPCGYMGLQAIDLSTIGLQVTCDEVAQVLGLNLCAILSP